MRFIVSENRISSAVSKALVEGVVFVIDELLVTGVVFMCELSKKATLSFVRVDIANFPCGIVEEELMELISEYLIVEKLLLEREVFLGDRYL